ncbi:MAG: hypothetical protein ACK4SA_11760, partial [Caldilinea sp.]
MSEQYKQAGVDIDAGAHAVALMKAAVQATYTPAVLAGVGSFGGVFALDNLPAQPVLVASIIRQGNGRPGSPVRWPV